MVNELVRYLSIDELFPQMPKCTIHAARTWEKYNIYAVRNSTLLHSFDISTGVSLPKTPKSWNFIVFQPFCPLIMHVHAISSAVRWAIRLGVASTLCSRRLSTQISYFSWSLQRREIKRGFSLIRVNRMLCGSLQVCWQFGSGVLFFAGSCFSLGYPGDFPPFWF